MSLEGTKQARYSRRKESEIGELPAVVPIDPRVLGESHHLGLPLPVFEGRLSDQNARDLALYHEKASLILAREDALLGEFSELVRSAPNLTLSETASEFRNLEKMRHDLNVDYRDCRYERRELCRRLVGDFEQLARNQDQLREETRAVIIGELRAEGISGFALKGALNNVHAQHSEESAQAALGEEAEHDRRFLVASERRLRAHRQFECVAAWAEHHLNPSRDYVQRPEPASANETPIFRVLAILAESQIGVVAEEIEEVNEAELAEV